jgi:hypothetical protein
MSAHHSFLAMCAADHITQHQNTKKSVLRTAQPLAKNRPEWPFGNIRAVIQEAGIQKNRAFLNRTRRSVCGNARKPLENTPAVKSAKSGAELAVAAKPCVNSP